MWTQNSSEMVAVYGKPCAISPRDSNVIIFPHNKIRKYPLTSDAETYDKTDHVSINRRRQSSAGILQARYFRRTDSNTDHCLAVARCRERLSVSKRAARSLICKDFIPRS
jgi:hypothetical protein